MVSKETDWIMSQWEKRNLHRGRAAVKTVCSVVVFPLLVQSVLKKNGTSY